MLKNLKSLFVVEEKGGPQPSEGTSGNKTETPQVHQPASQTFKVTTGSAGAGNVQEKFLEVLFAALENSNQAGFDYMEFKNFLRSLADVPMDDLTRYKSAFATAQTMGATKANIVSSAKHYITILANEQTKFQQALSAQKDKNLTGKQDEIKQLEQTIKTKEAEIEKLKADLEDHRKQIGGLEVEINEASEKITQTADDFAATYQALLSQIEQDINHIESHL